MGNQFEIKAIDERHFSEYLKDESRLTGKCGKIVFPKDEAEAERIAAWAWKEGKTVTVQGARTGIAGAAVPKDCDLILNMEKMDRILGLEEKDGVFFLSVEPGVTLEAIKRALETKKLPMGRLGEEAKTAFFNTSLEFPPNPTEKTASIGGVFSCGAAGMNERAVGATSGYFEEITILSPQRGKWEIRRGELVVQSLSEPSPWKKPLVIDGERDMLDFLCGSEGMFGAITKLKLRLAKRPRETWGILCFFQEESQAAAFALELAETAPKGAQCRGLEFFDRVSLELVELLKKSASKLGAIPAVPECAQAAVYVELASEDTGRMEAALEALLTTLEKMGGKEELTWAASEPEELEKFHLFRHAVPESVNHQIDKNKKELPCVTKIAADFCAPTRYFGELLALYRKGIRESGLMGAVFGHVHEAHLHVNLLPKTEKELVRAKKLVETWAENVVSRGGWIARENGIGKLKKELYQKYLSQEERRSIKKIKDYFDPHGLLNPGNLL